MFFKKQKKTEETRWQPDRLPRHIAIVLDGNGRWATKRALPRTAGHAAGAETFRRVATYCKDIGIEYLTVYAFSTENWKRAADEVEAIMGLLEKYLYESIEKMERDKVKMKFLGDTTVLSQKLQDLIAETEELSKRFDGVQVNICLNYGGRAEILRAAQRYAEDVKQWGLEVENTVPSARVRVPAHTDSAPPSMVTLDETVFSTPKPHCPFPLTEETFSKYLYTADIPDPDLIIRPSGEMRLSNFLLWQSAYSEFYSTEVLWPDFDERELDRAIVAYQARDRRYGGVK